MPFSLSDSDRVGKIFGFSLLKGNVLVFYCRFLKSVLAFFKVVPEPSIYFTGTFKPDTIYDSFCIKPVHIKTKANVNPKTSPCLSSWTVGLRAGQCHFN